MNDVRQIEETVLDRNRVQKRETSHLQVITGQTAYEGKSQEELRLEDYRKNLRGPANSGGLLYVTITGRNILCDLSYQD